LNSYLYEPLRPHIQGHAAVLTKLKEKVDQISLEALAGNAESVAQAVEHLPDMVDEANVHFAEAVAANDAELAPIKYSNLAKRLVSLKYTDLMNVPVFTPPGMRGSYLEHLANIEAVEPAVLALRHTVIAPFAVWVNLKLSNPGELNSVNGSLKIPGMTLPDNEELGKRLMANIAPSAHQSKVPYKQVIARNADWPKVEFKLEEINNKLLTTNRKELLREVKDLTDSLDLLITRMKEYPEEYKMSGQTVNLFAKTCYNVGRALELYSIYSYQVRLLTVAVEDTQKQLETYLNDEAIK
jgi:hypothetical protein